MEYRKPAISAEDQADLLLSRGLQADREALIARLQVVNCYRLSGYLYPFRLHNADGSRSDTFRDGTTFAQIWRRYNFDRRLRLILLDAIERIEVAVRTGLVLHFVMIHGPFGHLEAKNLPRFKHPSDHELWLSKLQTEKNRASKAKNPFVVHFENTYGDMHDVLPLWMACELMTCDTVLTFAYAIDRSIVKRVAAGFHFPDDQFLSWTKSIFTLRNACAHHARIWNRVGGAMPGVPGNKNKNPDWYAMPRFAPDRIGHVLCVCFHWLSKVSPTTSWKGRLFKLFDEYPDIPLAEMGIPDDWRDHPLWQ